MQELPMASVGSVTVWIGELKDGDGQAAQQLWERYFEKLVILARRKLRGAPRRAKDEEDVALSVFDSLFQGTEEGRFPRLDDRHDLWRLLVHLTAQKAADQVRHELRQKRDCRRNVSVDEESLDGILGREPTADFAAQVVEECQWLLARLDNAKLREVAVWKMEGYTNQEIAAKHHCVTRSVERRLDSIRKLWCGEV
jgi:DNA-directed RNA polymerase specialized sigma24 family protein